MIRKAMLALLCFVPTACWPQSYPKQMTLMTGAHPAAPVLINSLRINGQETVRVESVESGGWANPKGQGSALLNMPRNPGDPDTILVEANWVDLLRNTTFTGQIEAPVKDLTIKRIIKRSADVIVLFGPNGYLELSTSADPDASGQYNGRIVATSCGASTQGLSSDHWVWDEPRYKRAISEDRGPAPDMGCPK